MEYYNGDKYDGEWEKGKKHGTGTYTYSDEDYYEGEWVNDAAHGKGFSMIDGVVYEGDFSLGLKNGLG